MHDEYGIAGLRPGALLRLLAVARQGDQYIVLRAQTADDALDERLAAEQLLLRVDLVDDLRQIPVDQLRLPRADVVVCKKSALRSATAHRRPPPPTGVGE